MKKAHLKIVLVTIFAALLSGCTWLNTETEGGISRGKLIVGMVAFGAGIAGIAHSDSDSGDTILPTRPTTGGGDDPDLPVVSIATSNTAIIEGGAVTLTITSTLPAPPAGLSVTINISVADATEFTSAACTGLECVIFIPSGMTAGTLTIMASTDSDVEGGSERWTATLGDGSNYNPVTNGNADAAFTVANMLPPVMDSTTLVQLNAYAMSVAVAAPFRQGQNDDTRSSTEQTLPIVEAQYNDASGNPQILTQRLQFAALGVWVSGDATAVDGFQYASLAHDVVAPPTQAAAAANSIGLATYDIEGDAVYKGLRLYPDGRFNADFNIGAVNGTIDVRPGTSSGGNSAIDDFGTATPTLANGTALGSDPLFIRMRFAPANPASIDADGFSSSNFVVFEVGGLMTNTNRFFLPLLNRVGEINGRFHAETDVSETDFYRDGGMATSAPPEMSGTFSIMDGTTDCGGSACELKGGFLGDLR